MSPPTTVVTASDGAHMARTRYSDLTKVFHIGPHGRTDSPSLPAAQAVNDQSRKMLPPPNDNQDALLVLLPLLIILSSLLLLLLVFLICVLLLRRRRGILLRDNDGPVDMSREELIDGEGGFEGVESRWLESVDEELRRGYLRAKDFQTQSPPNSLPTDITLSQFLAIQEKGVSAWSFEPDYESMPPLLVHARTEITFLPDPSSSSCVQSNLPLPKLNEVYYWEVKMFDLPATTNISVGLATKPYPSFRLPGHNRYSVAYHSNGDKSHNYPFTQSPFGPVLKEGDVLGVGYRPRSGTVFYTRNGRKLEDAFIGLTKWNLFPTIGADGPCSVHVNLGQSGFVFIEANVKKWGLAPSVGTLAPPPAYGAERGSILLEAGGDRRPTSAPPANSPSSSVDAPPRRVHRSRRPKPPGVNLSVPPQSPQSHGAAASVTPIAEETSPTSHDGHSQLLGSTPPPSLPASPSGRQASLNSSPTMHSQSRPRIPELHISAPTTPVSDLSDSDSPHQTPNPPTPNVSDIHMHPITSGRNTPVPNTSAGGPEPARNLDNPALLRSAASQRQRGADSGTVGQGSSNAPLQSEFGPTQPPAYSPLDAYHYPEGVAVDLPAEIIAAALEAPGEAQYEANTSSVSGQQQRSGQRNRNSRRSRRSDTYF